MNTAAKSAGEAPASQEGRPPGRRPTWQRVLMVPGVLLAGFLVVRALVELATIHYNVPASYAKDWGGPSLAGVLAVHAGPGIAVALGTVWWVLRHGPARGLRVTLEAMTERKPPQMSYSSWIDQQIADAERRGLFDDLPGAGKPLNIKPGSADGDYGQAWLRDYARREGVAAEEMLPTPLRLRKEIERLAESAGEFRSEAEVREAAADLNRRIVEWRRLPVGPPIHVRLVNADDMVGRWQAARAARQAEEARAAKTARSGKGAGARADRAANGNRSWWRPSRWRRS